MRYQTSNTKLNARGQPVFSTALPTVIPVDINDSVIITDVANRLDLLAYKYYGASSLWWAIAQANHLVRGTLHIPPGTQLIIPAKNKVL